MSLEGVCRACLRSGRTMCSLVESIVPKFDSPPNSVVDLWTIFAKMLISYEDGIPNKICSKCLDEIQRTYSFILKCKRSEDILTKIKYVRICLKKLKIVSGWHENDILKNVTSENYLHPNESKSNLFELIESKNGHDDEDTDIGNVGSQADPRSQHTLIVQHENDNFGIELDHLDCENNVTNEKVSATQDIKQEPELDISLEEDEFGEIDIENKSRIEFFKCSACHYESSMMKSLEEHIIENHMDGHMCKLCNKEFECTAIKHCSTQHHVNTTESVLKTTKRKKFKCSMCPEKFKSKYYLKRHLIIHTGEQPFKCETCSKLFSTKQSLTIHLRCHTGERPFKCKICSKLFSSKQSLTGHLTCHTGERPFKCEMCSKMFSSKQSLTSHLTCHTGELPFKCEICLKLFSSQQNLTDHLTCHTDERSFKCEICSKLFSSKQSLTGHLTRHTGEWPFKCEICMKTYQQKQNLKVHLRYHTGERPFKCEICPKTFRKKIELTVHLRCHTGERPFVCEICSEGFQFKHNLKRHLLCHTGERPFKCELCPKSFQQQTHLTGHLRSHTGERPFKCEICSKSFQYKGNLTTHLKCHTGERPFKCDICMKTYRQKGNLKVHLRCHAGERQFKCEICSQAFGHKEDLTVHLRCHTGERPFKCEICRNLKSFREKRDLTRHLRMHKAMDERNNRFHTEQAEREQETIHVNFDNHVVDQETIVQNNGDNAGNELNDLNCENDATKGKIPGAQDAKQEVNEFIKIESEDKCSTETLKC